MLSLFNGFSGYEERTEPVMEGFFCVYELISVFMIKEKFSLSRILIWLVIILFQHHET